MLCYDHLNLNLLKSRQYWLSVVKTAICWYWCSFLHVIEVAIGCLLTLVVKKRGNLSPASSKILEKQLKKNKMIKKVCFFYIFLKVAKQVYFFISLRF